MVRKRKASSKAPAGDYVVGYGRPPVHSRFKPGQSGNAKGRPAGTANMNTLIEKALVEKVTVTDAGRRRKISKGEVIAKQIVNKAASGDLQAARLLLQLPKSTSADVKTVQREDACGAPAPTSPPLSIDYSELTTAEMMTLYDAQCILDGHAKERPPPPLPPGDPEQTSSE